MAPAVLAALPAIASSAMGLGKALFSGARKAEKRLERFSERENPNYTGSKGIMGYYNEALSRYGVSPTESALYKTQMQGIGRNVATGIGALQGTGNVLGGISTLVRGASDATLNANVAAEQERNRRFSQLGTAAQMKAGEEAKEYQYNKLMPFERKYNLLAQKAAGKRASQAQGWKMVSESMPLLSQTLPGLSKKK